MNRALDIDRQTAAAGVLTVVAIAAAWATGLIRPANETLTAIALEQVDSCMAEDGETYPTDGIELVALDRNDPVALSYDRCMAEVVQVGRFSSLGFKVPSEEYERLKSEGYQSWECVENAGYQRKTGIPLSAPDGYPLAVRAGHFEIGEDEQDLIAFYEVAAECDDRSLESMRDPDGSLSRGLADGGECTEHQHDGDRHRHGCFYADE